MRGDSQCNVAVDGIKKHNGSHLFGIFVWSNALLLHIFGLLRIA